MLEVNYRIDIPDCSQYPPSRVIQGEGHPDILVRKLPLRGGLSKVETLYTFFEIYPPGGIKKGHDPIAIMSLPHLKIAVEMAPKDVFPKSDIDVFPKVDLTEHEQSLVLAGQKLFRSVITALMQDGIVDDNMEAKPFPDRPLPPGFADPGRGRHVDLQIF